jgi:sugar-specific transcriptional regulator TrmB
MAGLDELVQRLQALGFSQYEARAYCALLQESPANGHEVAKTAGIPTSKIYETLERLHQKGAKLDRARERLTAVIPAAELASLAGPLRAAADRGIAVDLVTNGGAAADLPDGDGIRVRRRPGPEPDGTRLAVVVGDGEETVLADRGRERPEGMWTHDPAVALLAAQHQRALG